ncbi:ATP/GTP-binding site motif A [Prochlorococcus marinus str. MIT 9321]|uniref:ATP/GTP-binding site motif A n=1 Tax=Prochlorococcus marinus str. MIT 9401 TaxID=167551 RepID=A0A0A2B2U1_PROMR|nr:AAA family ATPase [Prochlorococcus marinus]KGG04266.1 ATP/GTP-binding site motif A [Prochlorococcus marinus str. MIT 9321]KGG06832.1 ATP/GTP-binding site motif A [Prochlorococcus marinus str. MIT 9322]KGG06944.1 ATP/GTP-binding site motif A [Prochlorococcus marinus str. MIT 9401]
MKLIFISGPSGSGKTTLSNQIIKKNKNGFVLSTDNYYKTGLISKFLSKLVRGFFDKRISFNYKLFKKDFDFVYQNRISMHDRYYNFEKKTIQNVFNETNNISFLIVEGIFAKEISKKLNNQNYYFIEIKTKKNECLKRVLQRDLKERGKDKKQAKNDFLTSWDIYYEKFYPNSINNNTNKFIIRKNSDTDEILKKIFN